MSRLEDLGFQSFVAHDSVGAVDSSRADAWFGGAIVFGSGTVPEWKDAK